MRLERPLWSFAPFVAVEFVAVFSRRASRRRSATCHLSLVPSPLCYNLGSCSQAIIRQNAGVSGLKKIPILLLFLLPLVLICLGGGCSPPTILKTSGLR